MKKVLLSVLLLASASLQAQYNGTGGGGYGTNYGAGGGTMTASGGVYTIPQSGGYGYNMGAAPAPVMGMDQCRFEALKRQVHCQAFDDTKLTIAKQAIVNNPLTAMQVRELAGLFTFESTKLKFAKFAYAYTVNPYDYYVVNDVFTFGSSVRELNLFISGASGCAPGNGQFGGGSWGAGHGGNSHQSPPRPPRPGVGPAPTPAPSCGMMRPPVECHEFETMKSTINKLTFDSDKLTIARQIASARTLNSRQVREIMLLFTFESSRMEFAQAAYKTVGDPWDYWVVNDAFHFSSSITELQEFMASR